MRKAEIAPAILFGVLVGWLLRSLIGDQAGITPATALGPTVTVFMGWWIQRAIRHRSELDKIPLESISRLCTRIETLVHKCLDVPASTPGQDPELVKTLQLLSNEIGWLLDVVGSIELDGRELKRVLFAFKRALSGSRTVDLRAASEYGRAIRTKCLILQTRVCDQILRGDADISVLDRSTD